MNSPFRSALTMSPGSRRFMLTVHLIFSVGWLGAVAVFMMLLVKGMTSQDMGIARTAYAVLAVIGWWVIVPACFGSLLTGLILSFGSQWGLFKYYWVLVKFLLTAVSTILLLMHMQPVGNMAKAASADMQSYTAFRPVSIRLVAEADAAMLVLIFATVISVYKPWGKIGYWLSEKNERQSVTRGRKAITRNGWGRYLLPVLIGLLVLFVVLHLAGGGLHKH